MQKQNKMTIQEVVNHLVESGISIYQLSRILGVTAPLLYKYKDGSVVKPGIDVVYQIYKIYNIIVLPYSSGLEIERGYKGKYDDSIQSSN